MSRTKELAKKLIYATLVALKENDKELSINKLFEIIETKVYLDDWAKASYEKTGYIRWQSILQFYSIDLTKAEYILKEKGIWYLTPEGENVIQKGEDEVFTLTQQAYKKWYEKNKLSDTKNILDINSIPETEADNEIENIIETENQSYSSIIDDAQAKSNQSFYKFILEQFNGYEFQDLCAALLRGMGYYTPFIAPKGKDGGIDLIAYKDPIGSIFPHIKVQVKHRADTKATSQEVRELKGVLNNNDIGVFISVAGFASDAIKEFKHSNPHIELVDLDKFIQLWQEFYNNMKDEDKALIPIYPIYFVDKK